MRKSKGKYKRYVKRAIYDDIRDSYLWKWKELIFLVYEYESESESDFIETCEFSTGFSVNQYIYDPYNEESGFSIQEIFDKAIKESIKKLEIHNYDSIKDTIKNAKHINKLDPRDAELIRIAENNGS